MTLFPLEPYAGTRPGSVTRATAIYGVHAYHTKVPVEAIEPFILQHSRPGDVVLDPFCGSGMTGLAALRLGRRALLSDLSPAAVHIARNYVRPGSPRLFTDAVARVDLQVQRERQNLYSTTCHACGGSAETAYVVWSDVRICPHCRQELCVWEHRDAGLRQLRCSGCGNSSAKANWRISGEAPVAIAIDCGQCGRLHRDPVSSDLAGAQVDPAAIPYWYPRIPFGPSRPMWRASHSELGITAVADFFSGRNLRGLAALWAAIRDEPTDRSRAALAFAFTAIVNRASRRYQWNPKRPTNVLGGTLYVSSLRYEFNVFGLWRRKAAAVRRLLHQTADLAGGDATVAQASATQLPYPSESVDYCFTDPPFGANIVYSDCSLLWEAWLDDLTPTDREAVISPRGKTLDDYAQLMSQSFGEVHRVLKPHALATVVFQNTDLAVWEAILDAAVEAGFNIEAVEVLHKRQPSFKGVKAQLSGERVAASDIVMTIRRATPGGKRTALRTDYAPVWAALRQELVRDNLSPRERSTGHLYAVTIAAAIRHGLPTTSITFESLREWLKDNCVVGAGGWSLLGESIGV